MAVEPFRYSIPICIDPLFDVLVQAFAILPRFNAMVVAHIDDVEDIGQMTTVIPLKYKYIMLRRQGDRDRPDRRSGRLSSGIQRKP